MDTRLQNRIHTKHFDSPDPAAKYEYLNNQNNSGMKRSTSFMDSQPICMIS